jgi:acetyltransferase-like isoleucine patch superfamily enzyme
VSGTLERLRFFARETPRTPWKAVNELRRLAVAPFGRIYFWWHGVPAGSGLRLYGLPVIQRHRESRIELGRAVEMRSWFSSNPLGVTRPCLLVTWLPGALLRIGDGVGMSGCTVCAQASVSIGSRVLIGANSVISDTDSHALDAARRAAPGDSQPVVIEDDVFIGMHVIVLKGAHIGRGSVIGAGSVVTGTIPAGVIAAGNPARVLRDVDATVPRE